MFVIPERKPRSWRIVATRCVSHWTAPTAWSDGVALASTYRLRHVVPEECAGIRLVFTNWAAPGSSSYSTELDNTNPVTVAASIENPAGGVPIPATFNGSYSVAIAPGGTVISDVIPVLIPAGTTIYTRTRVSVASTGQKWVRGITTVNTNSEGNNITAVANPSAAPTLAAVSGGTLPAGTYRVAYSYSAAGATGVETLVSPSASITVTANQAITVTYGAVTLPSGAQGRNLYLSTTGGDDTTLKFNTAGTSTPQITALSPGGNPGVPASNNMAGADLTQSTAVVPTQTDYAYGPVAILGVPSRLVPVVGLLGDSIITYQNDSPRDTGFAVRALNSQFPYITLSKPSDRVTWFSAQNGRRHRLSLWEMCGGTDVVIYLFGTNDLANGVLLTPIQDAMLADWKWLGERGAKVFVCTVLPRTSATYTADYRDSGGTAVADGSLATGTFASLSAFMPGGIRDQLNTWLKSKPENVAGCFDVAATVESTVYPGCWADASYQADGIHPSPTGHAQMAVALSSLKSSLSTRYPQEALRW